MRRSLVPIVLSLFLITVIGCTSSDSKTVSGSSGVVSVKVFAPDEEVLVLKDLEFEADQSVFQVMEMAQKKDLLKFSFKEFSGIGRLITTINGVEQNTTKGHYWFLCVNGKKSMKGADERSVNDKDVIEWHYGEEAPCESN